MKVAHDEYLISVKPLLQRLVNALNEQYPYASVLATAASSKQYSVSRTGVTLSESAEYLNNCGFVVRVFDATHACGEYSFNEISEENLPEILAAVQKTAENLALSDARSFPLPEDEPLTLDAATDYAIDPETVGDGAMIDRLSAIRQKALGMDERLLDVRAFANYQKYTKIFLSKNRDLTQSVLWTVGGVITFAARGEEIMNYYLPCSGLGGMENLADLEKNVDVAVNGVLELLQSEKIVPGEYDCICTPEVTGMIVHEAFGHGVEMDMFVKNRALAKQYIGKRVASPLVTMHDGAAANVTQAATYFFDDEGTLAHDTVVIQNGILLTGISDYLSAKSLGTAPTGNGRRESWQRKAYTRMTNTYFEPGKDKLEDMIASISHGYLLSNASSGMEDPKNWGIQCMVSIAKEIKDGKLTGKICSPIVLTGYVPDLLQSISMMSDGLELGGSGACGKGYKEWVKVSDGGPYIKAKIRLG